MNPSNLNILIVDDSATTRAVIKRAIRMSGVPAGELLEAEHGQAALQRLDEGPVGLMLMDLNMPVMDGFELIRRVRENHAHRDLPIVVISAQPDGVRADELKRQGVRQYVSKPFTPEIVRDLLSPTARPALPGAPSAVTSVSDALLHAVAQSLNTMAFICAEPRDPAGPVLAGEPCRVVIAFTNGLTRGQLELLTTVQLGEQIAATLVDSGATATAAAQDVLKELANVACGVLLSSGALGGSLAGYMMCMPVFAAGSAEAPAMPQSIVVAANLVAEGHGLTVRLMTRAIRAKEAA